MNINIVRYDECFGLKCLIVVLSMMVTVSVVHWARLESHTQ